MASVEKRMSPDGRVAWIARWRDDRDRQRAKSFRRRADAEQFLTTVAHSMLLGTYVDPAAGRLVLGEWAERWLASRTSLKPKTIASYESTLASQVLPRSREVPLARITYASVAAWVSEMTNERRLSPSRVRAAYHLLTGMLDAAVKDRRLSRNPARGVDLPRLLPKDRRFLTHEQLRALAAAAGDYRVLVLTLGYGGLRWGEATGLRVRDVDLVRGRLHIVRAVVEVNGHMLIGTPKSHQSRAVVLPRFLADEVRGLVDGKGPDDLVFTSPNGSMLRVQNFRRRGFDRAAKSVGLEGLVPHELRHTAASLAIASGASVKAVQRMLGHASATLTLDRYGHLFGDELDEVAARLDQAAAKSRVNDV